MSMCLIAWVWPAYCCASQLTVWRWCGGILYISTQNIFVWKAQRWAGSTSFDPFHCRMMNTLNSHSPSSIQSFENYEWRADIQPLFIKEAEKNHKATKKRVISFAGAIKTMQLGKSCLFELSTKKQALKRFITRFRFLALVFAFFFNAGFLQLLQLL